MAEQIKLDVDLDALARDIRQVKDDLVKLGDEGAAAFKQVATAAAAAGDDVEQAFDIGVAEGMADALNDLQKEYKQLEGSANTLRAALRRATDPDAIELYSKSIAKLEAGMSKLEKSAKEAGVQLQDMTKKSSLASDVVGELGVQLGKAALIAAAISAVKDFAKEAINLAAQTERATRQFTAFLGTAEKAQKVVDTLRKTAAKNILPTKDVLEAGKALLAFGETAENLPVVLTRIANISRATGKDFKELTSIYGKARTAGVLYAEDINQLLDAGINILPLFAEQLGVSVDQVKKLGSEGKIGFAELELAFAKLTTEGGKFAGQAQAAADASDRFSVAWESALTAVGQFIKPVTDAFINLGAAALESLKPLESGDVFGVIKAQAAQVYSFISGQKAVPVGSFFDVKDSEAKSKEILDLEKKAAEERKKLAAKNAKDNAKAAAQYERERQQAVIDVMAEGEAKELAIEQQRFNALTKELRRFNLSTEAAEEQHQKTVIEIRYKYLAERLIQAAEAQADEEDLARRSLGAVAELDKETQDLRAKNADENKKVQEQFAALATAEFDKEQQMQRVRFFGKQRSEKEIQDFEKEAAKQRELFQLTAQAAELQRTLDFGQNLTDVERSTIQSRIDLIKGKIAEIGQGGEGDTGGKGNIFLKLLGIDPNDDKTKKALADGLALVKNSVDKMLDERVRLADAEAQAAENRINILTDQLKKEEELQAAGFANNVENIQKQIAAQRDAQKQALEEKKRAQRAALLIDTATQVSNTAVAITNIIRDYSSIPFVGILLGFAQVAALFASLSAARAKAKAINAPQFRHGGQARLDGDNILVGPTHEGGGIGIEAENGEAVFSDGRKLAIVSRKMTDKHFDLIQAINQDDRPKMYDYIRQLIGERERFTFDHTRPGGIAAGVSTKKLETLQQGANVTAEKIERNTRPTEQWQDMGDRWRMVKGNNITFVNKRK